MVLLRDTTISNNVIQSLRCGMIYRRVEHTDRQVTKAPQTKDHISQSSQCKELDALQRREFAISAKVRRRTERKRNDLQQYRRILGSFKRIRILSTREIQKRSVSDHPSQNEASTESISASWKSVSSSFLGLDSHQPAGDWCYYFPTDDTMLELEDMKHRMLELACGDIIFALVKDDLQGSAGVMDLGNGSGIWALFGMCPNS